MKMFRYQYTEVCTFDRAYPVALTMIIADPQDDGLNAVKNRSLSRRTETYGVHRDIYHPDHEQWLQESLDLSKMLRPASRMSFRTMPKFAGLMPDDWALWKVKCTVRSIPRVVVSNLIVSDS